MLHDRLEQFRVEIFLNVEIFFTVLIYFNFNLF